MTVTLYVLSWPYQHFVILNFDQNCVVFMLTLEIMDGFQPFVIYCIIVTQQRAD